MGAAASSLEVADIRREGRLAAPIAPGLRKPMRRARVPRFDNACPARIVYIQREYEPASFFHENLAC